MRGQALSVEPATSEVEPARQRGQQAQRTGSGPGSTGSGTARRPLRMELSEREGSVVSAIRGVGRPQILWAPLSRDIQSVVRSY